MLQNSQGVMTGNKNSRFQKTAMKKSPQSHWGESRSELRFKSKK